MVRRPAANGFAPASRYSDCFLEPFSPSQLRIQTSMPRWIKIAAPSEPRRSPEGSIIRARKRSYRITASSETGCMELLALCPCSVFFSSPQGTFNAASMHTNPKSSLNQFLHDPDTQSLVLGRFYKTHDFVR